MNIITKAIADIHRKIPKAILERVFGHKATGSCKLPTTIDFNIKKDIVHGRVLEDCNIVGGTTIEVPLQGLPYEVIPGLSTIVTIPKILTQGRSLISVDHVTFGLIGNGFANNGIFGANNLIANSYSGQWGSQSLIQENAKPIVNALSPIPITSTSDVKIIGENIIEIINHFNNVPLGMLKGLIENDENLSNIPKKSWFKFSELLTLAVKSHIYTKLIIEMDQAELSGGQALGAFKNIVEEYRDAEELYVEFLTTKWSRIAFLSDPEQKRRMIKSMQNLR